MARQAAYFAGLFAIYVVLETHFEYLAEHQFFYNRVQHATMHHIGPFLLAVAWPGATLARGAPKILLRLGEHPATQKALRIVQQPLLAGFLFVGLIFFWLVPPIHFRAMLDPDLYCVMNWSMVIDGLLFWFLVLDPRPCPPATISIIGRLSLAAAVIIPQVMGGAIITLARHDLYPYYALCGRIYPGISPLADQTIGGAILWGSGAMMSGVAVSLILSRVLSSEDETPRFHSKLSRAHSFE